MWPIPKRTRRTLSLDLILTEAKADADGEFKKLLGQCLIPLDAIESSDDSAADKLTKLRPLHAAITGAASSGPASGANSDNVNQVLAAANRVFPTLSTAEVTARQGVAVRVIVGDMPLNGDELQEVIDARSAVTRAEGEVRTANTAKDQAEADKDTAEARVAELENLLRRAKTAIKGGIGGEGIKDTAVLNAIKAAV